MANATRHIKARAPPRGRVLADHRERERAKKSATPLHTPGRFIKWFAGISIDDVPQVGGKNASLGEMVRELTLKGVKNCQWIRHHCGWLSTFPP